VTQAQNEKKYYNRLNKITTREFPVLKQLATPNEKPTDEIHFLSEASDGRSEWSQSGGSAFPDCRGMATLDRPLLSLNREFPSTSHKQCFMKRSFSHRARCLGLSDCRRPFSCIFPESATKNFHAIERGALPEPTPPGLGHIVSGSSPT
jgi:hypothetical protein